MFSYLPSGKLTWPWKTKLLKMYSLLKNGDIPIALLVCRRVDFWWIFWAHELYIVSLTITIHVWYIYLHLVHFYGKCREIYQSHGWYGLDSLHNFDASIRPFWWTFSGRSAFESRSSSSAKRHVLRDRLGLLLLWMEKIPNNHLGWC